MRANICLKQDTLCVGEERRTHVLAHEMVDAPARTFAFSLTY